MNAKEQIIQNMQPLIEQAKREGLLLKSNYQGILFEPEELEFYWKEGRFVWGPINWTLVGHSSCDTEEHF